MNRTVQITLVIAMFCTVWAWHFLFAVMFLPSMIALVRGHRYAILIVLGNVFLGWTPFWVILAALAAFLPVTRKPHSVRPTATENLNDDGTVRI